MDVWPQEMFCIFAEDSRGHGEDMERTGEDWRGCERAGEDVKEGWRGCERAGEDMGGCYRSKDFL